MAGEGRLRGKIPLNDDRTSRQVIQITCAGETSPKTASQNSSLPFSSARAAMADAGINFFNFHGMAWLSRVSTATCCGVSLAPFVRGDSAASSGRGRCGVRPVLLAAQRRRRASSFGFCFMTISACIFSKYETNRNARSFLSARATAPEVPRSMDSVRNLKRTSTQYRPHLPQN